VTDTGRLAGWFLFVGLIIAVNWASRLSSGRPDPNAAFDWAVAIGSIVQFAVLIGIVLALTYGAWDLLALRRPRNWPGALGVSVVVLIAVYTVSAALSPFLDPGKEQGIAPDHWRSGHAAVFAVFATAVVVGAPLAEELTFRGLGYSLLRPFGLVPPIAVTSVLWALAHGILQGLPIIIALGLGLAWLRHKQDSVIPGMVLHASFNAIALTAALLV
jgi:membrane protease YdiL (CAAX protease family)